MSTSYNIEALFSKSVDSIFPLFLAYRDSLGYINKACMLDIHAGQKGWMWLSGTTMNRVKKVKNVPCTCTLAHPVHVPFISCTLFT